MKKTIFAVSAILLMAGSLSAQNYDDNDTRGRFHIGVRAGANYSNMYDSENEDYRADAKFGFVGGAFLSVPIGTFIGIQPEVMFSQKGFKASGSVLGNDISFTRTTNYIDVPIFLAIKPIEYVTILVGPQYSYLMKQKDVFANPISDVIVEEDFENENIRKNTFSLAGGIDANIGYFVVGLRVGWDLFNNTGDGESSTPRYKNAWAGLTLGVRL